MRTNLNFSPLFRSTIGFDRVFDRLENAASSVDNWPPYDIVKTGEDTYRIVMAVAGFSDDDLTVICEPNMLVVAGEQAGDGNTQFLHHGIASGAFEQRFELADHVEVTGAKLDNGLLTIDLEHALPEEMKPRRIPIAGGAAVDKVKKPRIEAPRQAA